MATKTTALVLNVNDDIRISYHPSGDAAQTAAEKIANFQEGFVIGSLADLEPDGADSDGMSLPTAKLVYPKLGGLEGIETADLDHQEDHRRYVRQLLLAK